MAYSPSSSGKSAVCLLFGPQCDNLDESILHIRRAIKEDKTLEFLADILTELPSLWPLFTEANPALAQLSGNAQLTALNDMVQGKLPTRPAQATNILLTPLTVIQQLVDFLKLRGSANHPAFGSSSLEGEVRITDAQGFCVGTLAAIAVASSRNESEFRTIAAKVTRLAVYVGAVVDLDQLLSGSSFSLAIRWRSPVQYVKLQQFLSNNPSAYISCITHSNSITITAPSSTIESMTEKLGSFGLTVQVIGLQGRFHHGIYCDQVKLMSALCEQDNRFQLPSGNALILPLRSTVNGRIIKDQLLHNVAMESILTHQCHWWQTVTTALEDTHKEVRVMSIGAKSCVPRSVRSRMLKSTSELVNEFISSTQSDYPQYIAITGMAARYPGANSLEELWETLELGKCAVREMPDERFKFNLLKREPKGPFFGNFLDRPDAFDHRFFGISNREAENMDPQQRLLLQVAYEAMESSGYCGLHATDLPNDVGCYVGVGSDDYTGNVGSRHANAFSATGTLQAFNTGRISHHFGWSGPSVVVDTACSSAAVAIHLACKALRTQDCSIAVAGGVNIMTNPQVSQNLGAASFLSPTGASKAFDASADGYCRGEGAGLVVLRPLEDAIRNHDPIFAVISGSAVNQGSNCSPITVPDSNSQRALYSKALSQSGISPDQVTYVEAHGTGTQVGDPIEFESIRKMFANPRRTKKLYVGSIKDNIGHTETSSGVAGLLKTVLMIQNQRIPKQANFVRLNPKIPSPEQSGIVIPTQSMAWTSSERIAMVTNYGAAGSNAAIVLKQHTTNSIRKDNELSHMPIILTAKSAESLQDYCIALHEWLNRTHPAVQDIAYNLAVKQNRDMDFSVSFPIMADRDVLTSQLKSIASKKSRSIQKRSSKVDMPVVLCFGGQTGNTANISQELFNESSLFQMHLMACENTGQLLGLPSLFPTIFQSEPIVDIVHHHHILFAIQYACAKSWIDSGLRVDRMIGHSFGQLTALCVSGTLSLSDCIRLISHRARLIQTHWGFETGVMLAIDATEKEVRELLLRIDNAPDVACVNSNRNVVIAGDEASIQAIEEIDCSYQMKRLQNTHAFHSRLVDNIVPAFTTVAQSLNYKTPSIPVEACTMLPEDWSSVTPKQIVQHSRNAVHFRNAVERIAVHTRRPSIWLEAGSGSPVIPLIRRVLDSQLSSSHTGHIYQATDLSGPLGLGNLANATSTLWSNGSKVQFWPFHSSQTWAYNWLILPPYQFLKTSHWIDYDPNAFNEPSMLVPPLDGSSELVQVLENGNDKCVFKVNTQHALYQKCTKGHAVVDQSLCPASMYIDIVASAAAMIFPGESLDSMTHFEDLVISSPLVLEPQAQVLIYLSRMTPGNNQWAFVLLSGNGADQNNSVTHSTGKIGFHPFDKPSPALTRFDHFGRLVTPDREETITNTTSLNGVLGKMVYQAMNRVTVYADYYRGVQKVLANRHEAIGRINLSDSLTKDRPYDPILLDNFLQVAGIHVNCLSEHKDDEVYVCSSIGEILLGQPFMKRDNHDSSSWVVYTNYSRQSQTRVASDIFIMDDRAGRLALAILGAVFTSLSIRALTRTLARLNNCEDESMPQLAPITLPKVTLSLPSGHQTPPLTPPISEPGASDNGVARLVQEMLCELLGLPLDEVIPSVSLNDIGVDSLMSTEVISEIKKRFNTNISNGDFAQMLDVQTLVRFIQQPNMPVQPQEPESQSEIKPEPVYMNGHASPHNEIPSNGNTRAGVAPLAQKIFATSRLDISFGAETKWNGFLRDVYPQQMALVTSYVVEAFRSLGLPLETFSSGQIVPLIPVTPRHEKLRKQLYGILQFSDLVNQGELGDFYRTENPVPTTTSTTLHEQILRDFAQHESEHRLLYKTGPYLASCLNGDVDGLSLIFKNAEALRLVEDVYTLAPNFKSATMHLTQYLCEIAEQFGNQRDIKILEIGAGTGGTTKYLLDQLITIPGVRLQYTFTDISSSLVKLARKKFQRYNFMHYTTLDISKVPPADLHGQFDVVLSSNCIHATRNLTESCTNIRKLLRPDGILSLIELTGNLYWYDLVFGLLEGWWLFEDGRQHALSSAQHWDQVLRQSGYKWVDWTTNNLAESNILRVIVASPFAGQPSVDEKISLSIQETVTFGEKDGLQLSADIYYPKNMDYDRISRPIALMIHGGGHVMLSRKDIRPAQTQMLLDAGFLPVSIDYRLCPETSLLEGPMQDVLDALCWSREKLPNATLLRPDVRPDGERVVAVGWSSGGHLAMTLAWTAEARGVAPPSAVLAFYCPSDYEDSFWSQPNFPFQQDVTCRPGTYDLWEGVFDRPITSYNPPQALGGWMAPKDPRSRIALHMNWKGQTLPILLHASKYKKQGKVCNGSNPDIPLPQPPRAEIQAISPVAQARAGLYKTPTFMIHGTLDDLIPYQQTQRTHAAIVASGIDAEIRILDETLHLFDMYSDYENNSEAVQAVADGYEFLRRHVE